MSKQEMEALGNISKSWKIEQDIMDDSVYIKPDRVLPSRVQKRKQSVKTSIRVDPDEWAEYVRLCKSIGTSTCREIRLFIHLKLEEARYPSSSRRFPGVG